VEIQLKVTASRDSVVLISGRAMLMDEEAKGEERQRWSRRDYFLALNAT